MLDEDKEDFLEPAEVMASEGDNIQRYIV